MGEVAPVKNVPREEIRQTADREIRETVSDENSDLDRGIALPCAQGGADTSVASSDDEKLRQVCASEGAGSLSSRGSSIGDAGLVASPRTNW